jgi:hypothetical protein
MKRYRLSRGEADRLNRDTGSVGENIVTDQYTGLSAFRDAGPFDLASESGQVAEVKSALSRLANGNRGRFRLFEKQHEDLTQRDREGSAWYIFVWFDVNPDTGRRPVADMVRRKPAHMGRVVGGRGGWNRSGHHSGRQKKLPRSAVF